MDYREMCYTLNHFLIMFLVLAVQNLYAPPIASPLLVNKSVLEMAGRKSVLEIGRDLSKSEYRLPLLVLCRCLSGKLLL